MSPSPSVPHPSGGSCSHLVLTGYIVHVHSITLWHPTVGDWGLISQLHVLGQQEIVRMYVHMSI